MSARASLRALCAALLLPLCACAAPAPSRAEKESAPEEVLLGNLVGRWTMTGTVQGRPVTYALAADRVLDGRFVRLHMKDVKRPPGYEAMVFIGYDGKSGRCVAHWMDGFGAKPSETLGYGHAAGLTLVFDFDYPDGAFRDTFSWDGFKKSWRLLAESRAASGEWSTFADYRITRVR